MKGVSSFPTGSQFTSSSPRGSRRSTAGLFAGLRLQSRLNVSCSVSALAWRRLCTVNMNSDEITLNEPARFANLLKKLRDQLVRQRWSRGYTC